MENSYHQHRFDLNCLFREKIINICYYFSDRSDENELTYLYFPAFDNIYLNHAVVVPVVFTGITSYSFSCPNSFFTNAAASEAAIY